MKEITLEELKKEDLCFCFSDGKHLYDYGSIEDFFEKEIEAIDEQDIVEFQTAYERVIEDCKNISVFKKDYFEVPVYKIEELVQDYFDDNYNNEDDYEVQYSENSTKLLEEFLNTLEQDNQYYTSSVCLGYIDLSKELRAYCEQKLEESEDNTEKKLLLSQIKKLKEENYLMYSALEQIEDHLKNNITADSDLIVRLAVDFVEGTIDSVKTKITEIEGGARQ